MVSRKDRTLFAVFRYPPKNNEMFNLVAAKILQAGKSCFRKLHISPFRQLDVRPFCQFHTKPFRQLHIRSLQVPFSQFHSRPFRQLHKRRFRWLRIRLIGDLPKQYQFVIDEVHILHTLLATLRSQQVHAVSQVVVRQQRNLYGIVLPRLDAEELKSDT